MNMTGRLIAVLVGVMLVADTAAAQNFLEERRDGINKEQQLQQPPKSFGNKGLVPPSFGKWNQDPNNATCPSGSECADANYKADEIKPDSSTRLGKFNNYGSMLGFQAGMNSKFHVDATVGGNGMPGYLNGDLTLAYITMGLTEPAVAAGLAQAVNYIGHDVNNRLQGEQVFFTQLQYMPDISQSVGQAYINCIAQKTESGENWLTAQAACSGDTAKGLTSPKDKFEDISGGKSILTFEWDPNHDSAGGDAKKILLTDYIFYRDGQASPGAKKFKDAFKEYVGDIVYQFDESTNSNLGTRQLQYNKILPTIKFADKLKPEAADNILKDTLLKAFEDACTFVPPSNPTSADQGDAFLSQLSGGNDWATKLSFPGFAPDSNLMRMLWELTADPSTGSCPNGGDYSAYEWDNVVSAGSGAPEMSREYMYIAQRIAFGRLYSLFLIAEDYLRRLNVGPFDSFARQGAFELLYDAAGTSDMHAMFDQNTIALREYFRLLGDRTRNNKKFNKAKGMGAPKSDKQQISNGVANPTNG